MTAACASTAAFVRNVGVEQFGLPTPCDEWDVRSLLNHIVGTLELGRALLCDTAPDVPVTPGGVPPVDLLGDDHVAAYRGGVDRLLAVATPDAFTRIHSTPFGDMPGAVLGGFTTVDILVHGWDLAIATGQDAGLDDQLATEVLAFAHQTITDDTRAPRIGPAIPIDASASPTDQLVGFLGRKP
jgi:uncharacterized protein (TIGR03086 family)